MITLPVIIRYLHLLGAVIAVGAMVFFTAILTPALGRALNLQDRLKVRAEVRRRLRIVLWVVFIVQVLTGLHLLMRSSFSLSLALKVLLALLMIYIFMVAPRFVAREMAAMAGERGPVKVGELQMYWAILILGLVIIFLAKLLIAAR